MKVLDIFNIIFLIPISIILIFFLSSLIFGCSMSGSDMLAHCEVEGFEPILTTFGGITLILSFSGIFWIIPAIIIAIISFKRDYKDMKTNNLPFKSLFKKISFYAIIPYSLLLLLLIISPIISIFIYFI